MAGLIGPTLLARLAAEFPLVQPHLDDAQIPPVVYLSGVLMFVGGLAVAGSASTSATTFMIMEGILFAAAVVMTVKAYSRN